MLDELERLHKAATPAPWGEFCESSDWWVQQKDTDGGPTGDGFVCSSNAETWKQQEDIDLMIASRNALPALLRVVRAAAAHESARQAVAEALRDRETRITPLAVVEDATREELRAALEALTTTTATEAPRD